MNGLFWYFQLTQPLHFLSRTEVIYEDLGCSRQAAHPQLKALLEALHMEDTLVT